MIGDPAILAVGALVSGLTFLSVGMMIFAGSHRRW